ncbi:MAG: hypothetical protein HY762_05195 [Planctomycetes bacterium]|nr:hypothetical protein [Planctomycetota bacterium]
MEVQYRRLARVVDKGVFFYEVVNLIKQCPPEAWVKEIKLEDYVTKDESSGSGAITPSDGTVAADGAVSESPAEPMKQYIITVKGYLEDDNPQTLDNLKRFVAELNAQPIARTGGGHEPLLIKASLNKLNKPEAPTPLGKMQFEIVIINK